MVLASPYDQLIREAVVAEFPELTRDLDCFGWLWVRAQMHQESRFNPLAKSSAGAVGLMQLMPKTAKELGVHDRTDPRQNVFGGVRYLADQYRHMGEIPVYLDRLKMALACYNGGRGYVNVALALARKDEGLPANFSRWNAAGRPGGAWQEWDVVEAYLSDPDCRHRGKTPDARQMREYVAKITRYFESYL